MAAGADQQSGPVSMSKHVAVLMGGWSAERGISLLSGKACAEAASRLGYRVTRIDVGRDIATVLGTVKPDVALNVLHGRRQTARCRHIRNLAIPYTHSGVMASAVAMQKEVAKSLFRAAGCRSRTALLRRASKQPAAHAAAPYVIKPLAEGSSVGVFIVTAEYAHPPPGAPPSRLAIWRAGDGGEIHSRQGVDMRRHGAKGAGRHRDRVGNEILRL
jgi:D-alanine-D-alanine ligase